MEATVQKPSTRRSGEASGWRSAARLVAIGGDDTRMAKALRYDSLADFPVTLKACRVRLRTDSATSFEHRDP
jgi:hypothetical protein